MITKSKLKKLPFLKTGAKKLLSMAKKDINIAIRANKEEVDGETVLVLSIQAVMPVHMDPYYSYRKDPCWTEAQVFLMNDGVRTRYFLDNGTEKWSQSLKFPFGCYEFHYVFKKEKELVNQTLCAFLGKRKCDNPMKEYKKRILEKNRMRRNQKEMETIISDIERFKDEIPKDYDSFSESLFLEESYVFIKEGTGYCTACKTEFPIKKGMTNKKGKCPNCGQKVTYKSALAGRKSLTSVKWSMIMDVEKEDLLFRYFKHVRSIAEDYKKPQMYRCEEYRSIVCRPDDKSGRSERRTYETGDYKNLGIIKWRPPFIKAWFVESVWNTPLDGAALYKPEELRNKLSGTWLKYSALAEYAAATPRGFLVELYASTYNKCQYLEKLIKCSFFKIVDGELIGYSSLFLNEQEEKLNDLLGITKSSLKVLQKNAADVEAADVVNVREYENIYGKSPTVQAYGILAEILRSTAFSFYASTRNCSYCMSFCKEQGYSLQKFWRYIQEQKISFTMFQEHENWLKELGVTLNEFTLFPKNFKESHDRRYLEVLEKRDEIKRKEKEAFDKKLKAYKNRLQKELQMEDGIVSTKEYLVKLPDSIDELDTEGATLHHCVATYKKRVMNGETNIYFIRKKKEPDVPFFTMEYKNNAVQQVHGLHNCDPTPEVQAVVDLFTSAMQKRVVVAQA